MDDESKEIIHKSVHDFLQEVANGMQDIPKEFEEDKKYLLFFGSLGFSNKVLKAAEDYGMEKFLC